MELISNLLLVIGVAVAAPPTEYLSLGQTAEFTVEVDIKSLAVVSKIGGYQITSTIRRKLFVEEVVKGKRKKGAYYIERIITKCAQDSININKSTLFAADGTAVSNSKNLVELINPHVNGNFVTNFINIMCNSSQPDKPGIIT